MENFNEVKIEEQLSNQVDFKIDEDKKDEERQFLQSEIWVEDSSEIDSNLDVCLDDASEIVIGDEEKIEQTEETVFCQEYECVINDNDDISERALSLKSIDDEILKNAINHFNSVKCEQKVSVYAKFNKEGYITNLASNIFLKDFGGWTKIDEGEGDRFVHPQICYFEDGLTDEFGNYIHKGPIFKN